MNQIVFKKMLTRKKITQAQLARELSMSPQRISDMRARRMQGWKYRSRICRYLGVAEEILFPDKEDQ